MGEPLGQTEVTDRGFLPCTCPHILSPTPSPRIESPVSKPTPPHTKTERADRLRNIKDSIPQRLLQEGASIPTPAPGDSEALGLKRATLVNRMSLEGHTRKEVHFLFSETRTMGVWATMSGGASQVRIDPILTSSEKDHELLTPLFQRAINAGVCHHAVCVCVHTPTHACAPACTLLGIGAECQPPPTTWWQVLKLQPHPPHPP